MKARLVTFADRFGIKTKAHAFLLHPWAPWATLSILLLIALWVVSPHHPPRLDIPYTSFIQQVRADNVFRVEMQGDRIRGVFKKAVSQAELTGNPGGPATAYTEFGTLFPAGMTDPRLLPMLDDHGVTVIATQPSVDWLLWWRLISLLPLLFLMAVSPYLARRAQEAQSKVRVVIDSEAQRMNMTRSYPTLADVVGQQPAKEALSDVVEYLQKPDRFRAFGAEIPRAVLLIGPVGSGKTLLARAVAGEARAPLFSLRISELVQPASDIVSNPIRDLFEKARETAPAVVLIDDLDALGNHKRQTAGRNRDPHLNQILVEIDSIDPSCDVVVLGATSRPEQLDEALLHHNRFGRRAILSLPERAERVEILRRQIRNVPLAEDVNLEEVARRTPGFSGADLARLANRTAVLAARGNHPVVANAEFDEALARLADAGEVSTSLLSKDQRRVAAYHEAGHGVLAMLLPGASPVDRLSILPHEESGHLPFCLAPTNSGSYTKTYLLTCLTILLGGRTAEELAVGDATTGTESDLEVATQLARRMVARWGMSDLGPLSVHLEEDDLAGTYGPRDLSEATASQIDRAVRVLLEDRHAVARHLLKTNRAVLDRLAELLSREETLDKEQVARLVTLPPASAPAPDKSTNNHSR
jgi:cell division protease FtsH